MKKAFLLIACLIASGLFLYLAGCISAVTAKDSVDDAAQKSSFNFVFKYGVTAGNELDTFHGTFTKDMVMDPAITIELVLSAEEMDSVYQKMAEIDFFNYPDEFSVDVPEGAIKTEVAPYSTYSFRVTYGGKTKELLWHDKITNSDEKADKLKELINLIRNIVESKEEYKNLPEPGSGYL